MYVWTIIYSSCYDSKVHNIYNKNKSINELNKTKIQLYPRKVSSSSHFLISGMDVFVPFLPPPLPSARLGVYIQVYLQTGALAITSFVKFFTGDIPATATAAQMISEHWF